MKTFLCYARDEHLCAQRAAPAARSASGPGAPLRLGRASPAAHEQPNAALQHAVAATLDARRGFALRARGHVEILLGVGSGAAPHPRPTQHGCGTGRSRSTAGSVHHRSFGALAGAARARAP